MKKYEVNPEWTRQALVVYGGLIGIGIVILQALLPSISLDLPSLISILSFAVAIPLLATAVLINHAQASYRYATYPWYFSTIIILGEGGSFLGVLAAFWHLSWIAAVILLISGIIGILVYGVYSKQIVRDNLEEEVVSPKTESEPTEE